MDKKEFLSTFGEVEVTFSSYYKYTFTFEATLPDGRVLYVSIGGHVDDIYRMSITNNQKQTVLSLDPDSGSVRKGDELLCDFYDS